MVVGTLDGMAAGGMYDQVGGGFHRYSVDAPGSCRTSRRCSTTTRCWPRPTSHAWAVTGKDRYREIVEETLEYVLRELALPDGAFASSQDADTDGVEGLTFTWTADEGVPEELLRPFEHGRSVIRGRLDPELRARLFAERERRPKPARDDKAIASWNGLLLAALAEAGRRFERPEWLHAARRLAEFMLGPLSTDDGRLYRTWRDGRPGAPGFLPDYADVANGLLELHAATGELRWLEEANRLGRLAVELFGDAERGGFFLSAGEELVARRKDLEDQPTPSGNASLAWVMLRLARIYGDAELERRAVSVFRLIRGASTRVPLAFGWALSALDLHFSPPRELAIMGPADSAVARAALAEFDPRSVVAFGPAEGVPLLEGKDLVDGNPAVYVCENFACRAPVTDPREIALKVSSG